MQIRIGENRKEIKDHGNYAFPVNVSDESIQAYERGIFLWHWHKEVELTWIMSGKMEYRINNEVYEMKAGEALFGNSNALHAGFQKDGSECHYLSITFHPRFLYGYEKSILQTKYVNFITENENWSSLKLSEDVEWQRKIILNMKEIYQLSKMNVEGSFDNRELRSSENCEQQSSGSYEPQGSENYGKESSGDSERLNSDDYKQQVADDYELQVQILLLEIWQKLYKHFNSLPAQKQVTVKNVERIRSMLEFIQEHYDQNIGLEDIAEYVNICKSECCRFFKKHMNMTIFEYLMYLRIQNSLPMLERDESITSIAGKVGFASTAYYGQIFKRYMNCTPREYKKRLLERV